MNNRVTIFMPLLNEGTNVSRPIEAQQLSSDTFLILGSVPTEEEWAFQPGTKVRCVAKISDNGATDLVADEISN